MQPIKTLRWARYCDVVMRPSGSSPSLGDASKLYNNLHTNAPDGGGGAAVSDGAGSIKRYIYFTLLYSTLSKLQDYVK